ncbi:MAG: HAMP domain-containing histidine kinase [Acidobacteria bacterium]|nr:HAMP domain-containing histidine kinase [Acidobacteriota bacterium]
MATVPLSPSSGSGATAPRDEVLARLADANASAAVLLVELETAREELEARNRQLDEARRAAEESARCKTVFLANMSHELRTPLNAIIGYSELLLEDPAIAAQRGAAADLDRIRTAGLYLLTLIGDVLDLSKIEAGGMTLHLEPVHVRPAVETAVALAKPLMAVNRNTFHVALPRDEVWVMADPTRLRQCLLNLLSNAAKFTTDGDVRLDVDAEGAEVRLHVRDTGVGIVPEQMGLLFQSFVQVGERHRSTGGTGLGLVISQKLARLMGGDVTAVSAPGVGSTFTVSLPLAPAGPTGRLRV